MAKGGGGLASPEFQKPPKSHEGKGDWEGECGVRGGWNG